MLPTLVHTVIFIVFVAHHAASMQIDTPTLTQCQDTTINFSGGQGDYGLYVVPSLDPCADTVVNFPLLDGAPYKWKVNLPAGSKVEIMVEDAAGDEGWSGEIVVQNSTDASCVDPKAVHALIADMAAPTNASLSPAGLSAGPSVSTTIALPSVSAGYASGVAKSVTPVYPSGVANVAGGGTNTSSSSAAIPHAALPAGSSLSIAALLLTMIYL